MHGPLERFVGSGLGRRLLPLERQRRHWLDRVPTGALRDCYGQPFPPASTEAARCEFVVLDFETTGLDPARAEILSMGFVVVRALALELGERVHRLVRPDVPIASTSAVVHGILDDRASTGEALGDVLPVLFEALAGRVLVAHHAPIECGLLDRACRALYGCPFVAPVVDTLALERRTLERRGQPIRGDALRLAALRARYHLPRYRAHDALSDAVATGELLLAQIAHRGGGGTRTPRLKDLASVC